ncbi:MAG: transcription elongation factor GreAB, partial [Myxococcota bacterium]|nr:transcription elongation factor GreAB [Myxococcota bacterium]
MDKAELLALLAEALQKELNAAQRLAKDTADAANHPEARPENDKDTRKIELSYLAAGQASRAKELETGLSWIGQIPNKPFGSADPLQAGALAELDVGGKPQRVLLSPAGGGIKLSTPGGEISVVTPSSPLGRG